MWFRIVWRLEHGCKTLIPEILRSMIVVVSRNDRYKQRSSPIYQNIFFENQGFDKVISFVHIARDNYKLAMLEIYNLVLIDMIRCILRC